MNPSVNVDCTNLLSELAYCVQPQVDWDPEFEMAPNKTIVAAPAPTTPGTTDQCYTWHIPNTGETCAIISSSYGINFAAMCFWNPALDENCYNLMTGVAYCVQGAVPAPEESATIPIVSSTTARQASTTARQTSTSTSTRAATTTTPGSSSCGRTYTVVSGDYCYKVWTENNLTEARFRALNPSLNANCDLSIGQVLCVA